ncbi:hypothetical protein H9P43_009024 [Blastocladiella emersonii ATCC 22665]|nr:hypothetical protein H9P43_009024 [Blastocladiella emersonii ATCC 22665]
MTLHAVTSSDAPASSKRVRDPSDVTDHLTHAAPVSASTPAEPATVLRSLPSFIDAKTHVVDSSVDPASVSVAQWTGACRLSVSPRIAHLPERGMLVVANPRVYWWSESAEVGVAIEYRSIIMHAVQRGSADGEPPAVYCQLGVQLGDEVGPGLAAVAGGKPEAASREEDEDGMDQDDEEFSEMWIYPDDVNQVDDLFTCMSMCASMHPDPMDEDDSDDGDSEADRAAAELMMAAMSGDGAAVSASAAANLSAAGAANLARFEAMFEDAAGDE